MTEWRVLRKPDRDPLLQGLKSKRVNFDVGKLGDFGPETGWYIDDYRQRLPREVPGSPVPRGSWEIARRISRDYTFVSPTILRAYFDNEEPLEGRNMLLEVHFWGLRIYAGVRV